MREATDIFISQNGDIEIENKDIKVVSGDKYREMSAINRIKSIKIDWFYDNIGADMEEILGEPNTEETANIGKNKIIKSLTEDSLFNLDEIFIKVVPISKNDILYMIALKSSYESNKPIVINAKLDLVKGIVIT